MLEWLKRKLLQTLKPDFGSSPICGNLLDAPHQSEEDALMPEDCQVCLDLWNQQLGRIPDWVGNHIQWRPSLGADNALISAS